MKISPQQKFWDPARISGPSEYDALTPSEYELIHSECESVGIG